MILERSNCNRGMVDRERKRGKDIKKEVGVEMRKRDREKKMLEIDKEEGYVLWKWK